MLDAIIASVQAGSNSVIIPTRHRYAETIRLLRSLQRQTQLPDEVIVVDSSKEDYLKILLEALFPSAFPRLKYLRSPPGKTRQLNLGIRVSRGEIVSLLDDDMELEPDYLARILETFAAHPECAGGMGRITGLRVPTGMNRVIQRAFFLAETGGRGYYKLSGFPCFPHASGQFQYTEALSGACTHLRRAVALECPMDERLSEFGYSPVDDDDIGYRLSRTYKLFYQPAACCRHHDASTTRRRVLRRRLVRHHEYLFHKNSPKRVKHRVAFALSILGLGVHALWNRDVTSAYGVLEGTFDLLLGRKLR